MRQERLRDNLHIANYSFIKFNFRFFCLQTYQADPPMRKISIQPPYQRHPVDTTLPHPNNNHNNTTANASKVTFSSSMTEKFDHRNTGGGSICDNEDEKAMEQGPGLVENSRQRGGRYDIGGNHDIGNNSYH